MKTPIRKEFSRGTQSYNLLSNYSIQCKTIKIEIKLDSYAFQSYAKSFLFTDRGWKIIYSMPYNNMTVIKNKVSHLETNKCVEQFELDEKTILEISMKILNIE